MKTKTKIITCKIGFIVSLAVLLLYTLIFAVLNWVWFGWTEFFTSLTAPVACIPIFLVSLFLLIGGHTSDMMSKNDVKFAMVYSGIFLVLTILTIIFGILFFRLKKKEGLQENFNRRIAVD